jgi:hypothetical protein
MNSRFVCFDVRALNGKENRGVRFLLGQQLGEVSVRLCYGFQLSTSNLKCSRESHQTRRKKFVKETALFLD